MTYQHRLRRRAEAKRDYFILVRRAQIKRERVEDRQCERLNDLLERSKHITDKTARYLWLCRHGFYVECKPDSWSKWRADRERGGS